MGEEEAKHPRNAAACTQRLLQRYFCSVIFFKCVDSPQQSNQTTSFTLLDQTLAAHTLFHAS